jgi:hypothetical protein
MRLLTTSEALAVFMLRLTDDFKDAGMYEQPATLTLGRTVSDLV